MAMATAHKINWNFMSIIFFSTRRHKQSAKPPFANPWGHSRWNGCHHRHHWHQHLGHSHAESCNRGCSKLTTPCHCWCSRGREPRKKHVKNGKHIRQMKCQTNTRRALTNGITIRLNGICIPSILWTWAGKYERTSTTDGWLISLTPSCWRVKYKLIDCEITQLCLFVCVCVWLTPFALTHLRPIEADDMADGVCWTAVLSTFASVHALSRVLPLPATLMMWRKETWRMCVVLTYRYQSRRKCAYDFSHKFDIYKSANVSEAASRRYHLHHISCEDCLVTTNGYSGTKMYLKLIFNVEINPNGESIHFQCNRELWPLGSGTCSCGCTNSYFSYICLNFISQVAAASDADINEPLNSWTSASTAIVEPQFEI